MTKLKTLKDLPEQTISQKVMKMELKQEAIKHYKEFRKKISRYDSFKSEEIKLGSLVSYNIQAWKLTARWIKSFFNITDEDVK